MEPDRRKTHKIWSKIEDQTLLSNYDQFKSLPNCEEHLCLLINNIGFSDKDPIDVIIKIFILFFIYLLNILNR